MHRCRRISTSRDDAPAYLIRYENRRAAALAEPDPDPDEPGFVARARARATDRALAELDQFGAPPGRTEAFAFATTSPRELQMPESFRNRMAATTDVRLIRHGQTQGYITDGALTPLGRWQAHRKGQDLAKGIKEGATVRLLHAATARAQETAVGVREGVLQALSRYGIGEVTVEEPVPAEAFDNFQVCATARRWTSRPASSCTPTRSRSTSAPAPATVRAGWWRWTASTRSRPLGRTRSRNGCTSPCTTSSRPSFVVRRHWAGIVEQARDAPPNLRVFVCGHSGPIRALASAAVGHDPGEPYNVEDVRIRVFADLEHAIVTYRGRGVEIEIPTTITPSWHR